MEEGGNAGSPHSLTPLYLYKPADPRMTFDSYVLFKANSFLLEVSNVLALREDSPSIYNPVYIYSEVGMGKTHLLSAIANASKGRHPIIINIADLEVEFERARRLNLRAELRQELISAGILLLDDLQLCEGNAEIQLELFAVLNHIIKEGNSVVISSDVPPTRLTNVESRLMSRLGGGVILELQMGDIAERIEMLQRLLGPAQMPEEVINYLAQHAANNVRQLKAVVQQLLAMSCNLEMDVTVDMVRGLVPLPADFSPPPADPRSKSIEDPVPNQKADISAEAGAERFKEMFIEAETIEEQALALQISLMERLRQLRGEEGNSENIKQLEATLNLLRDGKFEEAIKCMES